MYDTLSQPSFVLEHNAKLVSFFAKLVVLKQIKYGMLKRKAAKAKGVGLVMLNIAICDDDAPERAITRSLLDDFLATRGVAARVREFASGKELLFNMDGDGPYDLYLLDVVMPEINGIELGVKLRENDETGTIIYLTTSEDFAIDSYEARAFWYLVKPVKSDKLFPILDKAIAVNQKRMEESVNVKTPDGVERLLFDEIYYVEVVERRLRYVHRGGISESTISSAPFAERVAPLLEDRRFYRCGASLVLNLQHVKGIGVSHASLRTGGHLDIPRRASSELRAAWTQYWLKGGGNL